MIILKFGGGTLGTPDRVERCLDLIEQHLDRNPLVVVSAHGDTTDRLIEAANLALTGKIQTGPIREYHLGLAEALGTAHGMIEPLLNALEGLLQGVGLLRELTPRTLDQVMSFGERLSSRIVAGGLLARGHRAQPVFAFEVGMLTDSRFGSATPLPEATGLLKQKLSRIDGLPVVTGFVGKNKEDEITTLGRSGSDFTATTIACALDAEEVIIYKDVDGVMTADPSVDARAENIPELSFEEASELAYFGAQVLHPATLLPAIQKEIPVRAINALKEGDLGTVILSRSVKGPRIAKSVVYKEDVTLFHLTSPRLHSVPRVLDSALKALEENDIVAHMIATSEAGISLITQSGLEEQQRTAALGRLQEIAQTWCTPEMAIICLVGEELRGRADTIGRVFAGLAQAGINGRVITRSASEINLAFLVTNSEITSAIEVIHSLILEKS